MHTKHSHSVEQNIFIILCFCVFFKTLFVFDFTLSKIMVLNIARTASLNCNIIILMLILHVIIQVHFKRSKQLKLVLTTTKNKM